MRATVKANKVVRLGFRIGQGSAATAFSSSNSRLKVALLIVAGITAGMQMGKAPLGLPGIRTEFHVGLDSAAWIVSTFPLIGAIAGIYVGRLARGLGSRQTLFAGLVILAAGGTLSFESAEFLPVLIGRMIEGLGFLGVTIAAPSLIHASAEDRDQRIAMALWSACIPVGIALTLLVGPIVAAPFGWRGLWLAGTCQVVLVIGLLAVMLPTEATKASAKPSKLGTIATVLAQGRPVLFAVVAGCYMFLFSMTALFPVMLVDRFGLDLRMASELISPVIVTGLAGGLFARWLSERGLAAWLSIATCALMMGAAGVGILSPNLPLAIVYILCAVFAALAGILPAIVFEGAAESVADQSLVPIAMGMVMQASNIGVFVGPIGFGTAIQAGGWIFGIFPLLGVVCALLIAAMLLRQNVWSTDRSSIAKGKSHFR